MSSDTSLNYEFGNYLFRWSKLTKLTLRYLYLHLFNRINLSIDRGKKTRAARFWKHVYTFPYLTQSFADGFPHLLSSWATADLIWHLARTLPCGRYLLLYIGLVVHNLQCLLQKISCNSLVMVLCMFLHTKYNSKYSYWTIRKVLCSFL